jgi:hypothetical protein
LKLREIWKERYSFCYNGGSQRLIHSILSKVTKQLGDRCIFWKLKSWNLCDLDNYWEFLATKSLIKPTKVNYKVNIDATMVEDGWASIGGII